MTQNKRCHHSIVNVWFDLFLGQVRIADDDGVTRKNFRRTYGRGKFKESVWWKTLSDPRAKNPKSREDKQFRRRFAVPYSIFLEYVGWARGWLPQADYDCAGRPSVPIELKVLGALRIVSKGWAFDGIAELTCMNESTIGSWSHKFYFAFRQNKQGQWIV
jgi:hypothetical protein